MSEIEADALRGIYFQQRADELNKVPMPPRKPLYLDTAHLLSSTTFTGMDRGYTSRTDDLRLASPMTPSTPDYSNLIRALYSAAQTQTYSPASKTTSSYTP